MQDEEIKILKQFFNAETGSPLGETAALESVSDEHQKVFNAYFDRLNYSFKNLSSNPTMIVGRRGAGKTDILLNYAFAESSRGEADDPTVYFKSNAAASTFYHLVSKISEQVIQNEPRPLVETVSDLWTSIFWVCLFEKILFELEGDDADKYLLQKFLSDFSIQAGDSDPYQVALRFIVRLQAAHDSRGDLKSLNFFSVLPLLVESISGIPVEEAKRAALNILRLNRVQAYILFDSFEDLDILDTDIELAVSGFLRAVGSFQKLGMPVDVRCCIPAEAYFKIIDISSNVMKDFGQTVTLHWSAGELMRVAAIRLQKFIEVWEPDLFSSKYASFDLSKRTDVVAFWNDLLPRTVPNTRKNARERTIPYIMRHTQLLPRQFLSYLNEIFSAHYMRHKTVVGVSEDLVTTTVRDNEHKIVTQIVTSYQNLWPEADDQLRSSFAHLHSNILKFGDLHRAFTRGGISGRGNVYDVHDFVRMLSELGAIGRLLERDGDYAKSVFEYSEPHKLSVGEHDTICLHPVFTEHYGVIQPHDEEIPDSYRAVYPLGCDPDDKDRRGLML